jgi:hypothetical protein
MHVHNVRLLLVEESGGSRAVKEGIGWQLNHPEPIPIDESRGVRVRRPSYEQ